MASLSSCCFNTCYGIGDVSSVFGKLRVLRALCQDVVELRRGDHSAARLKIEHARLEREREETEEEVLAYFRRWAKNPKVRAAICGGCVDPADQERRLRQIFGLHPDGPGRQNQTESNQIQPRAHDQSQK